MKNTAAVLSALGLVAFLGVSMAFAAAGVRGGKGQKTFVSSAVQSVNSGPTTVYSVIMGTGAVTDFVVLFDSANATTQTAGNTAHATFRGKYYASSATANTQITFDPPLIFNNGVTAICGTSLVPTTIVYEPGKVIDGR